MTFYELYKALDAKFPKSLSCDWDNDGIMCADDLKKPVKKVLIALDVTNETINYAIKKGYDTIISHHPLVFKAQSAICECNHTQKKLISLIKNGIRVMSFHTRLDAADLGVNDTLALALGFSSCEKDTNDPLGRICTLVDEMPVQAFAKKVKKALGSPVVSYIGGRIVSKVYLVGGDGKDMIPCAISAGADTLVTGNASYNSMLDAEEMGINVIEAGHFYTENPVCESLKSFLISIGGDFKIEIFDSNKINVI
ncbi:MAG: Nif3-like dinuclear metal center hexameric protein [Clostridia bacterium]|nr:Nif3-like dinuclear metal center hexameric protein [Clostridia bacterium]